MRRLLVVLLAVGCNQRPLTPSPSTAEALCRFDAPADPGRVVMAWFDGGTLDLVHADRSHTAAYVFGTGGAANVFNQTLVARAGRVAAAASWVDNPNGQGDWHEELVLIDSSGQVRWHDEKIDGGGVQLFLGEGGALAAALGGDGLVLDASGHERALTGLMPLGEPVDDDGTVVARGAPVGETGETPGPTGWSRPGQDELQPLAYPLADAAVNPQMVAGRLVYLGLDGDAVVLVSERPGDARTVPLGGLDPTESAITDQVTSGWVLVGDYRNPKYRVNVKTLEAQPIGLKTPSGLRPFQGSIQGPRLDDDGALLVSLRDDYSGALYRSMNGADWSRIGGTVTNVLDIDALSRGGTYLIDGTNGRYSVETWTPAPSDRKPDFDGDSVQLSRPEAGVERALHFGQGWVEVNNLQLSDDGLCLAYWGTNADGTQITLTAWDVEQDRSFSLGTTTSPGVFAWAP